jgi:hypothetical protein
MKNLNPDIIKKWDRDEIEFQNNIQNEHLKQQTSCISEDVIV